MNYPPSYRGPLPHHSRSETTEAELLDALRALDLRPRRSGSGWVARCPAHDDRSPSLSCTVHDGRLLLYCHAGCPFTSILGALGLRRHITSPTAPTTSHPARRNETRTIEPFHGWDEVVAHGADPDRLDAGLGLPRGSLAAIGAVWSVTLCALAAPMYAAPGGHVIGVRLRAEDGRKWAITGSRNGLFCPRALTGHGPLYLPEGMTDTAALAGIGLDAIGRPSCTGGRDLVRRAAAGLGRPLVVVSDADRPGREGAQILAAELAADGANVRILAPPNGYRDVREWVKGGATAGVIAYMAASRPRV